MNLEYDSTKFEGVSTYADSVDYAFWVVNGINAFLFLAVVGAMFVLLYKYRASNVKDEDIENITHNTKLEITWTVIPTILLGIVFYYGYDVFKTYRTVPEDAMVVKVTGKKWTWIHEYIEDGKVIKKTGKDLLVPVNTNVKLILTAPENDVLHAYYVQQFRMKVDVEPGLESYAWFNAKKTGRYLIQCAEYCGTQHSQMLGHVVVVEKDKFDKWLKGEGPQNKQEKMKQILDANACSSCHSLDTADVIVGPGFKGLYNTKVKVALPDGSTKEVVRDEEYLKRAILEPDAEVVDGYFPGMMMPTAIDENSLQLLIEYFRENK